MLAGHCHTVQEHAIELLHPKKSSFEVAPKERTRRQLPACFGQCGAAPSELYITVFLHLLLYRGPSIECFVQMVQDHVRPLAPMCAVDGGVQPGFAFKLWIENNAALEFGRVETCVEQRRRHRSGGV